MGAQAEVELLGGAAGDLPPGTDLPRAGRTDLGPLPPAFSLVRVARSHGWCGLAPVAYTPGGLHVTLPLPGAGPRTITVEQTHGPGTPVIAHWGHSPLDQPDRDRLVTDLRRMLAVDDDLTDLYAACARLPALAWVPAAGAGRLLRSPTVWEDLAKMLATTNCSWSLTRLMVRRLVDELGTRGPAGEVAFPTPSAVVAVGESYLRETVRAGYRSASFVALAQEVEDGLDVESWRDPGLSDHQVLTEIGRLRGFGPYAGEGMLGLLGRPRGLALDSWVRAKLPRVLGRDAMTDAEIAERYAPLGRWAGAGLWLELTADWYATTTQDLRS